MFFNSFVYYHICFTSSGIISILLVKSQNKISHIHLTRTHPTDVSGHTKDFFLSHTYLHQRVCEVLFNLFSNTHMIMPFLNNSLESIRRLVDVHVFLNLVDVHRHIMCTLQCKAKRQYLFSLQVSRNYILPGQSSIEVFRPLTSKTANMCCSFSLFTKYIIVLYNWRIVFGITPHVNIYMFFPFWSGV